jgi:hypothetical protein
MISDETCKYKCDDYIMTSSVEWPNSVLLCKNKKIFMFFSLIAAVLRCLN